jgi:hypothetical protein
MFWFSLGVAAGVTAARKVSGAARRLTPAGAAENVGDAVRELALAVGSFGADVRAGMAEREAELRDTVIHRTGIDTTPSHLARPVSPPDRGAARPYRARRATTRA